MVKLTNYEKHLQEKMKIKEFREAFEKEGVRLQIAYEINKLRRKEKLSQKALAKKIGTTQSAIARIETGEQNFTLDMLQKIASAFRCNLKVGFVK
ncbi:helix-turn-helix transcriptional regulator [Candidatus Parcubacteria bacterium]|nr:helix-turn-helix transcriptional regulator [Candidatus Parcubacteria bacterium]